MKAIVVRSWLLVVLLVSLAQADAAQLDVRRGIPPDAFLAVYGQHNPERDAQRQYAQEVWQTIGNEKLPERVLALVMKRLPGEQQVAFDSIVSDLQSIFAPVDWSAVANAPEAAYGQLMEAPQTHHLLVIRLPSTEVAATCETALRRLGEMIRDRSQGHVAATKDESGSVAVYSLSVSKVKEFPFRPAFARIDDVLVISTSAKLVERSAESLLAGGPSKFDDPRLQAALEKLPAPEDALVFYDAQQQMHSMRGIGTFIREQAGKDEKALRVAALIEKVIDQLAILDYEVTVEYTDGRRLCKDSLGQLATGVDDKLLYQVLAQGEPFENWQQWVPADAQAYCLSTGANLHALYDGVVSFLHENVPEAQPALDHFQKIQDEHGIDLDRDILQAFSGESVSVTLPPAAPSPFGSQDQVLALRCENPEMIRALIGQGIERLAAIPWLKTQDLRLVPSEKLSGFDELSMTGLSALNVRPVIGFHAGWMFVASNAAAADKVIQSLDGGSPSIASTDKFQQFGLEIEGPVYSLGYKDLAASTRQTAQFIRQAGMIAPMVMAGMNSQAKPEDVKTINEALALLPSVANVVEKFDYLEARLNVRQTGDAPGTYVKHCVTLVRPPQEKADQPNVEKSQTGSTQAKQDAAIATH